MEHAAHPCQVHTRVTQPNPVHEGMARFQGHLVTGVPYNKGTKDIIRSFKDKDLSQPLNQLPSVSWDLGAISEQQLHHGMVPIVPIDTGVAVAARDAWRHIQCTDGYSAIYEEPFSR
jgi:hypothetical protein